MTKKQICVITLIIALFSVVIFAGYKHSTENVSSLSAQDLASVEKIQKELDVTKKEAEELKAEIQKLKGKPEVTYYVTAPTTEEAAETVKAEIASGSLAIPEEAREETDRTLVVPTEQTVDVYKINLRNNHKIKAGVSYVDDHAYLSAEYQAGRVEGIAHFDEGGLAGVSVMYTLKEW